MDNLNDESPAAHAQHVLSETGRLLAQSIDYDATLQSVAQLLVPALADWCVVDLLEDDRLSPVAAMHTDPAKAALVHELRSRYPTKINERAGAPNVIRTGESELYEELPDYLLQQAAQDEQHLAILRGLKLGSGVVVPLIARGERIGAMTLISERTHVYHASDLPLFEELGRRSGLAVDNARLYRDAQRELKQRRESEERFRAIFDQAAVGIAQTDTEGRYVMVNDRYCEITGYSRDELIGRSFLTITHPDEVPAQQEGLQRVLESPESFSIEKRYLRRDGTVTWGRVNISVIQDEAGRPLHMLAVVEDVTDRKQAEEAVRRSEERLRLILESVTDYAIFTLDLDGRVTSWTAGARRVLGFEEHEILGQSAEAIFTPEDRRSGIPTAEMRQAMETGRAGDDRWQLRKDGTRLWANGVMAALRNADGRVQGFVKILRDETEAKHAREQLEARARQQAAVAELGETALAGAELQELLESAVRVVAQTLEADLTQVLRLLLDREELLLQAGVGWQPGRVGAARVSSIDSQAGYAMNSDQPVVVEDLQHETRFKSASLSQEHGVVSGMNVVIAGEAGRAWGVLGAHTRHRRAFTQDDVHFLQAVANILAAAIHRRKAEDQLQSLNESLEQRVAERTAEARQRSAQLQRMAAELTQAEQRERRRLAEVLHDHLQQLLAASKLHANMLRNRISDPEMKKAVDKLSDLLARSINTSRDLTVELSPPILYESGLVAALKWLARWMADKHQLQVTVDAEKEVGIEDEDLRILVFQSVRELLFNTAKYAETDHARVELRRREHQHLEVAVEDEGRGFDTADAYQQHQRGGFGLFSIRERLELMGGQISIRSEPGKGTAVTLVVPLHRTHQEPARR